MSFIEFESIKKSYDGKNLVLKNINASIEEGELVTLLGPSGCGKSTLLRCLAGFEPIDSGSIRIHGKDITALQPGERELGMVFQQYSLFPNMNVKDNIAFGLKMKKVNQTEIDKKVKDAVEIVGLSDRELYYPKDLSGGQKQRVALARALVTEPKVLLLDEPLSAIDAQLRKSLQQSIRSIQQRLNITSIFVTHDQDEAMVLSDRIFIMNNGQIEQAATPVDMYTKPESKFVASFMGNYNVLDADQFHRLTGQSVDGNVAIRPETISVNANDSTASEPFDYEIGAVVTEKIPKGNILSYKVKSNDVELKADELFRTSTFFDIGEEVTIRFEEHNCLRV